MTARCIPDPISHSYFVVMIRYPRRWGADGNLHPASTEAVVDPEMTRRCVVHRIVSGEYSAERIDFIHHIHDGRSEDVTFALVAEAAQEVVNAA